MSKSEKRRLGGGKGHASTCSAAGEPALPASDLMHALAGQMALLVTRTQQMDGALGASICDCENLSPEAVQQLQNMDYIRQSVRDMHALLLKVAPSICWLEGKELSSADLERVVDMRSSLSIHAKPERVGPDEDIWL